MLSYKEYSLLEEVKQGLQYHLDTGVPLNENIFRVGSEAYFLLYEEARKLPIQQFDELSQEILNSDIGRYGVYENEVVPLDSPIEEANDNVELNKPKRGGSKKFYVYVKNEKGNVIKVEFGDTSGLNAKINDPAARKSFAARHQCDKKNDKTTPGYWSCRLPWFAKDLGLQGGGRYFW